MKHIVKQNNQEVIYKLIVEDIQYVAEELLNRKLTNNELDIVKNLIGEKINWFDAIADTIEENINM